MKYEIIKKKQYQTSIFGISLFCGEKVEIIGEQTVKTEDNNVLDQYIYNIVGYTPANGMPFIALKDNITLV